MYKRAHHCLVCSEITLILRPNTRTRLTNFVLWLFFQWWRRHTFKKKIGLGKIGGFLTRQLFVAQKFYSTGFVKDSILFWTLKNVKLCRIYTRKVRFAILFFNRFEFLLSNFWYFLACFNRIFPNFVSKFSLYLLIFWFILFYILMFCLLDSLFYWHKDNDTKIEDQ